MTAEYISKRCNEIIKRLGIKKSRFYYNEYNDNSGHTKLFTKTRFYNVLNGTIKEPGSDFVPLFCQIAGISISYFYQENLTEANEIYMYLSDHEAHIIAELRQVELHDTNLHKNIEFIVESTLNTILASHVLGTQDIPEEETK